MELKHSKLGIASFITSIVFGLLIFLVFAIAGIMESSTPGGLDEDSGAAVMIGLGLFALLFSSLVAFGLGIAGLFVKERKKVFAILGSIISIGVIIGTILLVLLGLAME